MTEEKSNNQNLIIGAITIIGLLTLMNSYKIFFGGSKGRVIPPVSNQVNTNPAINNQGSNFPNTVPNQNNPLVNPTANPLQPAPSSLAVTSIKFNEMKHDFGEILQNSKNEYSFTFRNTGVEPLVISNAKGSCGCTVPNYPKEPVLPGETATIDVVYSPGMQSGAQRKTVTITANTNPSQTIIDISANVLPDPNAPKPEIGGVTQPQPINITPIEQ